MHDIDSVFCCENSDISNSWALIIDKKLIVFTVLHLWKTKSTYQISLELMKTGYFNEYGNLKLQTKEKEKNKNTLPKATTLTLHYTSRRLLTKVFELSVCSCPCYKGNLFISK